MSILRRKRRIPRFFFFLPFPRLRTCFPFHCLMDHTFSDPGILLLSIAFFPGTEYRYGSFPICIESFIDSDYSLKENRVPIPGIVDSTLLDDNEQRYRRRLDDNVNEDKGRR